jgi:integrase
LKLYDKDIKALKPSTKVYRKSDGAGLYIEVPPVGNKRWRFRYHVGGVEKLLSLGVYPDVSLKDARLRRDDARRSVANGVDPSDSRKAIKAAEVAVTANAFEIVAREWMEKQRTVWAPSNAALIEGRLKKNVFPLVGARPIDNLTAADVLAVVRPIEANNKIETAHRVLGYFSQIFRYAVVTGRVPSDPTRDLRGALPPSKEKHFAAVTDPDAVGDLLRVLGGYDGSEAVKHALRLAPLVFVRPGELRHAEWAHIDFDAAEWRYSVSKTNTQHIVPLARQAIEVLKSIGTKTGGGRYVFPSPTSNDRPMSNNAILAAMRRMLITSDVMCGHGFRAMARTLLDEALGFPPHLIEHQLAHVVKDPLGRAYNRTKHLPERKAMMQAWADYIDELKQKSVDRAMKKQSKM